MFPFSPFSSFVFYLRAGNTFAELTFPQQDFIDISKVYHNQRKNNLIPKVQISNDFEGSTMEYHRFSVAFYILHYITL